MITFIREWANQIIVAVIIATIFEMLLPNGNNKKYIKMVIGIYVLFTVIQPIASKLTGKEFEISSFNYEKYVNDDILETSSENFEDNNSNLIEQAYIDNIKNDIKAKIEQKGYELINCDISIIKDESKQNYGAIEKIVLNVEKIEEQENSDNGKIEVKKVEVVREKNTNIIEKNNITDEEKAEIIKYIAIEYSINEECIIID